MMGHLWTHVDSCSQRWLKRQLNFAAVNMLFKTMSGSFQQMSGVQWTPAQGWAFAGGNYSVCVGGDKGVFVETAKADYNALFKALVSR